jgi:hypothetical protein
MTNLATTKVDEEDKWTTKRTFSIKSYGECNHERQSTYIPSSLRLWDITERGHHMG